MIKACVKKLWFLFFAEHPLCYLGRMIIRVAPAPYVARLRESFFFTKGRHGLIVRAVLKELNREFYSASEENRRKITRQMYWGAAAGKQWHETARASLTSKENVEAQFDAPRRLLVSHLEKLLSDDNSYASLCEIGTGNGLFLNYLASRFPQLERFTGIDLNAEQVQQNIAANTNARLEFTHGEITDWLRRAKPEKIIFVAFTALEYFTRAEVAELLTAVRECGSPVAVILGEPSEKFEGEDEESKPRGGIAFCHNYLRLLRLHGFTVLTHGYFEYSPGNFFLNVLAVAKGPRVQE